MVCDSDYINGNGAGKERREVFVVKSSKYAHVSTPQ